MCTSEQASTKKRLRLQPKAMDPEERRRRLRKVYDILLAVADQAEAANPRRRNLPDGGCKDETWDQGKVKRVN